MIARAYAYIKSSTINITVSNNQSFMPLHYILCASMLTLYVACFFNLFFLLSLVWEVAVYLARCCSFV